MKTNELMIGNWVNWDGREAKISEGADIDYYINEGIEPIPLTEEWLVKLGLKDNIAIHNKRFSGIFKVKHFKNVRLYEVQIGIFGICTVDYVHELQNLYFALTGNELEIN